MLYESLLLLPPFILGIGQDQPCLNLDGTIEQWWQCNHWIQGPLGRRDLERGMGNRNQLYHHWFGSQHQLQH